MKLFECTNCGHIELDEAPDMCLVCHNKQFNENADAIKHWADPNAPTDAERKHTPQIVVVKDCGLIKEADCTDVHARVGEILHPMDPDHYIQYIDYYLDHAFISRVWLSPESCFPAAGLHLNATAGKITAIEHCNVHGIWLAETQI